MIQFNSFNSRHIQLKERAGSRKDESKHETNTSAEEIFTPGRRSKRQTIDTTLPAQSKLCIICNNLKRKGDIKRVGICENRRAKLFLSATKFSKDTVYDRCSLLGNTGDVFAVDILYHKNCMSSYVLKFDREVDQLINSDDTVFDNSTEDIFNRVITNLDVSNKAHYISNVQDIVNQEFEKSSVGKNLFYFFSLLSFFLFVWSPPF